MFDIKKRALIAGVTVCMTLVMMGCGGKNDNAEPTPTEMVNDGFSQNNQGSQEAPTETGEPLPTAGEQPTLTPTPLEPVVSLKQAEALDRGFIAICSEDEVFFSWRFLGTDEEKLAFNIYHGEKLLNDAPITGATSLAYVLTDDEKADEKAEYTLVPVIDGKEFSEKSEKAVSWSGAYLSVPVKQYEVGDYDINDASVGDLDGDGQYEIVVRREPADMYYYSRVAYPLIEAYKLDGTHMWSIDIGPNEINTVDINFLVYDMNGDGKAEIVMRSFEGTTDGTGETLGDLNGDGIVDYSKKPSKIVIMNDRSYLQEPPEYLSMYEGATGKELARTELLPARDPLNSWYGGTNEDKQTKRASHFVFCVAYLDGVKPSIVHYRGAWAVCRAAAFDIVDGEFSLRWLADCEVKEDLNNLYNTGYHSIAVADVDNDGKDEIITGAAALDDDGTIMYIVKGEKADGSLVKLGHGDAFDVAVMDPKDENQFYVWACRETPMLPANIGLHNARTGELLFGQTKSKDTGRCRAADIDPTNEGWELWGSTATPLQSIRGEVLSENCPYSMNMKMYWDGDLLAELVDHDANHEMNIQKWDWEKKELNTVLVAEGSASNGGTKGQTCLIADMLGDWREELIVRTADNTEMRIYSTTVPTEYRMPTLMHSITYREAIAWQNNHYNQPANTDFYFGAEMTKVPVPAIYTVNTAGEKVIPSVYNTDNLKKAFFNISQ